MVGVGLCVGKWLGACPVAGSALAVAASDACPGHRALAPGRIGRLPRPHRGAPPVSIYAALIGRTPNRYGRAHTQAAGRIPRPHRELSRYLCKLRDWAQAQSYAAGLPAVCHKWSGALPSQAYATTRHSPRLGALPGLRWQRERLHANATSQASTRFAQQVWPHGYCWYPPKIRKKHLSWSIASLKVCKLTVLFSLFKRVL